MTADPPADSRDGDAPKIEFPCDYPIKVVGTLHEDFEREVLAVVAAHAERADHATDLALSRKGTYGSLTIWVVATGEPQLRRMHAELMALPSVQVVL